MKMIIKRSNLLGQKPSGASTKKMVQAIKRANGSIIIDLATNQ